MAFSSQPNLRFQKRKEGKKKKRKKEKKRIRAIRMKRGKRRAHCIYNFPSLFPSGLRGLVGLTQIRELSTGLGLRCFETKHQCRSKNMGRLQPRRSRGPTPPHPTPPHPNQPTTTIEKVLDWVWIWIITRLPRLFQNATFPRGPVVPRFDLGWSGGSLSAFCVREKSRVASSRRG